MTSREFELWLEGYRDRLDRWVELLAWTQANLMNIHIPRGKPRMTVEKLLPKGKKKRGRKDVDEDALFAVQQALADDPAEVARERMRAKQNRLRSKQEEDEARQFWNSPEGRRIGDYLREE